MFLYIIYLATKSLKKLIIKLLFDRGSQPEYRISSVVLSLGYFTYFIVIMDIKAGGLELLIKYKNYDYLTYEVKTKLIA